MTQTTDQFSWVPPMTTTDETLLWDEYITAAKGYLAIGNIEEEELSYKRKIAEDLKEAHKDLQNGDNSWPARFVGAMRDRPGHPVIWRNRIPFNNWCKQDPGAAAIALKTLWDSEEQNLGQRIAEFRAQLPESVRIDPTTKQDRGTAVAVALASTLLMALDVDSNPPYNASPMNRAYKRTKYSRSDSAMDEGRRYENALAFLDRFIVEAAGRDLKIPTRLYAQSIIYALHGGQTDNFDYFLGNGRITAIGRQLDEEGEFDSPNEAEAREKINADIARRRGQPEFRSKLLKAYGKRCAITGYQAEEALEAAHIRQYKEADLNEVRNGLLLRADIHTLFDRHLIGLDPISKKVWIGKQLRGTEYAELENKEARPPRKRKDWPDPDALRAHWEEAKELGRLN